MLAVKSSEKEQKPSARYDTRATTPHLPPKKKYHSPDGLSVTNTTLGTYTVHNTFFYHLGENRKYHIDVAVCIKKRIQYYVFVTSINYHKYQFLSSSSKFKLTRQTYTLEWMGFWKVQ